MNANTVSFMELYNVAINLFGIWVLMRLMYLAYLQRASVLKYDGPLNKNALMIAVNRNMRCSLIRMITHFYFLLFCIWAAFLPTKETWFSFSWMTGAAIISTCITIADVYDIRSEGRMKELVENEPNRCS